MEHLTHRERQICEHLLHGGSNKEIGMSLGISPRTVEDHRRMLMKKAGVHNVVELVRLVYGITDETPHRFSDVMKGLNG